MQRQCIAWGPGPGWRGRNTKLRNCFLTRAVMKTLAALTSCSTQLFARRAPWVCVGCCCTRRVCVSKCLRRTTCFAEKPTVSAEAALGSDAVLDEQAIREYRRRLAELDIGLAEANVGGDAAKSSRLHAEREA